MCLHYLLTTYEEQGQPVGKQRRSSPRHIWYTAVSGIWQTVWLEPVPAAYISALELSPSVAARADGAANGTLRAQVSVRVAACGGGTAMAAALVATVGHSLSRTRTRTRTQTRT